ncbi:MAG: hypothetical protein AB7I19_09380 [Planctomycetota bacterium]
MMRARLVCSTVLACFGACASLRIDVDVYKGPLANEEQIQIQELIALATGAKPLLVQLRDELESNERYITTKSWRIRPDYEDGYMEPQVGTEQLTFCSAQAQSVNEVIGLYGDLGDAPHAERLARIAQLSDRYRYHFWQLVRQAPEQEAREDRLARLLTATGSDSAKALATFFSIENGQRPSVQVVKSLLDAAVELPYSPIEGGTLRTLVSFDRSKFGANVAFDVLAREEVWRASLRVVTGLDAQQKSEISAVGTRVAQSFLDARSTLRELMRECARLAIELLAEPAPTDQDTKRAHDSLVAALTMSSWRVLADGLQPRRAFSKEEQVRYPSLSAVAQRLSGHLSSIRASMLSSPARDSGARLALIARVLDWIDEDPTRSVRLTAQALLDLDELAASGRFRDGDLQKVYDRYGAAGGPTAEASTPLPESSTIGDTLAELHPPGLSGGRATIGLDRQTSHYLESTSKGGATDPQLLRELLRSLIQFGEKVRILSGMSPLLGSGSRDLFDILQAVGNSIITQADAIQRSHHLLDDNDEQMRHDEVGKASYERELDARTQAGRPLGDSAALDGKARNVLDHFARQLSYAFAQELATNGETEHAKRLAAAHAYIEEEMTKHIYLRHAAAYLRNSYPSPDLQPAPLHLQHGTGFTLIRDADRRKTAEKLDKQFWQNVNQVTVSGTGDTNMAMIKDDIGNWQLKEYSGDTRQIMKSMGGLVRFATSAGVSPAALMDAAQLQPLLDKARSDRLTGDDPKTLKEIRDRQSENSSRADSTASAMRVAVQQGAELNGQLRTWAKSLVADSAAIESIAVPKSPDAGAGTSEFAAAIDANHTEFRALFEAAKKPAKPDQVAKLAEFLTRRREQLRGLQLALFGSKEKTAGASPAQ